VPGGENLAALSISSARAWMTPFVGQAAHLGDAVVHLQQVGEDGLVLAVLVLQLAQPAQQAGHLGLDAGGGLGAGRHRGGALAVAVLQLAGDLLPQPLHGLLAGLQLVGQRRLAHALARVQPGEQGGQLLVRQPAQLGLHGRARGHGGGPPLPLSLHGLRQRLHQRLGGRVGRLAHLGEHPWHGGAVPDAVAERGQDLVRQAFQLLLQQARGGVGTAQPVARLACGRRAIGGDRDGDREQRDGAAAAHSHERLAFRGDPGDEPAAGGAGNERRREKVQQGPPHGRGLEPRAFGGVY
jgi:hypothetical protein